MVWISETPETPSGSVTMAERGTGKEAGSLHSFLTTLPIYCCPLDPSLLWWWSIQLLCCGRWALISRMHPWCPVGSCLEVCWTRILPCRDLKEKQTWEDTLCHRASRDPIQHIWQLWVTDVYFHHFVAKSVSFRHQEPLQVACGQSSVWPSMRWKAVLLCWGQVSQEPSAGSPSPLPVCGISDEQMEFLASHGLAVVFWQKKMLVCSLSLSFCSISGTTHLLLSLILEACYKDNTQ